MSLRYLPDTNIISDLIRDPHGAITVLALSLGLTLVTGNVRKFARMEGVTVGNGLR